MVADGFSIVFLFWDILRCRSSFFWFGGSDSILGFLVKLYVMQLYIFLLCHSWHCISCVFHCSFTSILIMSQTYEPDKKSSFLSVFHLETGFSNVLIFLGCLFAKSYIPFLICTGNLLCVLFVCLLWQNITRNKDLIFVFSVMLSSWFDLSKHQVEHLLAWTILP